MLINASLVNDKRDLVHVSFANGSKETLPVVEVHIMLDFITRNAKATVVKDSTYDLILGSEYVLPCKNSSTCNVLVSAVMKSGDGKAEVTPMTPKPAVSNIVCGEINNCNLRMKQ